MAEQDELAKAMGVTERREQFAGQGREIEDKLAIEAGIGQGGAWKLARHMLALWLSGGVVRVVRGNCTHPMRPGRHLGAR